MADVEDDEKELDEHLEDFCQDAFLHGCSRAEVAAALRRKASELDEAIEP